MKLLASYSHMYFNDRPGHMILPNDWSVLDWTKSLVRPARDLVDHRILVQQ